MRSPNTPWGNDYLAVTRNEAPLRKFVPQLWRPPLAPGETEPCTLEEYQAEQRRIALERRAKWRGR